MRLDSRIGKKSWEITKGNQIKSTKERQHNDGELMCSGRVSSSCSSSDTGRVCYKTRTSCDMEIALDTITRN